MIVMILEIVVFTLGLWLMAGTVYTIYALWRNKENEPLTSAKIFMLAPVLLALMATNAVEALFHRRTRRIRKN